MMVTVVLLVVAGARWASDARVTLPVPGQSNGAHIGPAAVAASPLDELNSLADSDQHQVEQLVGYWVPQVSSKMLGTVDGGTEFFHIDILNNHRNWATRYAPVLLLRSDDFGGFSRTGYWVTVIGKIYSTADDANSWCDAQGIPANDCFAKRLSHSPSADDTVHR